jgi:hypothetical protein
MNYLSRHLALRRLEVLLRMAPALDQDYPRREVLVLKAMLMARHLGYPAGYRIDPQEPDWPVAFIELPTGQVSWHMPAFPVAWDGHTTDEKWARIETFLDYCATVETPT